jgi:transposase-like protein
MAQRNVVHQIRRATQKRYSAEEKIRIVVEGLRGEIPVTELCRREGISRVISRNPSDTDGHGVRHGAPSVLGLERRSSPHEEQVICGGSTSDPHIGQGIARSDMVLFK